MNEPRVRDVLRVLCRIPVAKGQLGLYRLAVSSPEKGFTSTQVRALWNLDHAQHRGLMAALTVRINNTPRENSPDAKPGLGLLFNQSWSWDDHEYTYRPHAELLAAVQRLPALDALLQRPIEEVIATKSLSLALPDDVLSKPPDAEPKPPRPHAHSHFGTLLDAFEAADLVYPPELIANLLVALQVKRFVILTGISGTGKTRIAQKLADQLRQNRRVTEAVDPESDDLTAALQARPDTMKRRRFTLPRSLAAQIPALDQVNGMTTLKLSWPGGTATSNIWHRDTTVVGMPSGLWSWFSKTVALGETFLVQLEGPPGAPDSVRLSLPAGPPRLRLERLHNAEVVAVRPDWTDHRGLLGAYNPLTRQYMTTPFLQLLLRAAEENELATAENPPAPFFLILDEMNLARVEHYFADFLSALESGEPLHLHDSVEIEEGAGDPDAGAPVPRRLAVPPNVFFVGTVNVDESTYLFSPKVLDRAFALELNTVDLDGLAKGIARGGELDLGRWNGRLDPPAKPGRADWTWLVSQEGALVAEVSAFHCLLAHHNRHFGYRVATEIARFVKLAVAQATEPGDAAAWAALDLALLQKVLVKLQGTRHELGSVLDALLRFALVGAKGSAEASDLARWRYVPEESVVRRKDETADTEALFPRSAAKLWRMRERLVETGFTSWIE